MIHALKTWPEFFQAIVDGVKTFELRRDDRGFAVGDVLLLREWCPQVSEYTGREQQVLVTYVMRGNNLGLRDGFSVLGIRGVERSSTSSGRPTAACCSASCTSTTRATCRTSKRGTGTTSECS